jgi:demethylmenaquinone methyltransferase/2-methoxy-6-polyprenyl-1,4-benzoquinol methylase
MPPFDHFSIIAPIYARVAYSNTNLMRDFASLPVKGHLLDVGGGTGRVSSAICELVDEVIVADISFGMLKETGRSMLKPVCSCSEKLPFADNSFERVVMVDALHHVHNQVDSAREMYRVLKPGGVLVIEEPDIRTFGVKIIAIAEKLLLMQSHFLEPNQIANLFTDGEKRVRSENGTAWVVIKKQVTL